MCKACAARSAAAQARPRTAPGIAVLGFRGGNPVLIQLYDTRYAVASEAQQSSTPTAVVVCVLEQVQSDPLEHSLDLPR